MIIFIPCDCKTNGLKVPLKTLSVQHILLNKSVRYYRVLKKMLSTVSIFLTLALLVTTSSLSGANEYGEHCGMVPTRNSTWDNYTGTGMNYVIK